MDKNIILKRFAVWCVLISVAMVDPANASSIFDRPVLNIVDTNPNPHIFEASISIDEQDALINGTIVHTVIYKDDNQPGKYSGIPSLTQLVPHIEVKLGDEVIVHFSNKLEPNCAAIACNSSIHWHGIELDNDSDGSGVTQTHLLPGQDYTYRFRVPRSGIFWFHPHMTPSPQVFAGAYGILIVKDPREASLQANKTIPSEANTYSIVLSDTEFDAMGNVGYIDSITNQAVPWEVLRDACAAGSTADCNKFIDAATVLINGGPSTATRPSIKAKSGSGIRLQLVNTSTIRYFRLQVIGNGTNNNLYRIGGEGGLLDFTRLEGGILGTWDTGYTKGEIVLAPGQRADVVLVPTGNNGDTITIKNLGYNRGAFPPPPNPNPPPPGPNLLYIDIDNSLPDSNFSIAEGTPILGPGGVENIKNVTIEDFFLTPPVIPGHPETPIGLTDQTIHFQAIGTGMTSIDGFEGMLDDSGPNYLTVPFGGSTRYANVRDTLEFSVQNLTQQHHPFHLHGFSFQPVRVVDNATGTTLYTYDYSEFIDTIDVFAKAPRGNGQTVVLRVRLDDRSRITDTRPQDPGSPPPDQTFVRGGAIGRWVFHCHIFLHAATGMMSELVVMDDECMRDSDCLGGDICTVASCDLNQCNYTPIPNCCQTVEDCNCADSCTLASCDLNRCNYTSIRNCCQIDEDCDDNNPCTIDECSHERCEHHIKKSCLVSDDDDGDRGNGRSGGRSFWSWPPVTIPVAVPSITPVAGPPVIENGICPVDGAADRAPKMPESSEKALEPEQDSKGSGCSTTNASHTSVFVAASIFWILLKRRRA